MKILVYGAGVIGTLYAARLQEGGHCVTVASRAASGSRISAVMVWCLRTSLVTSIDHASPHDRAGDSRPQKWPAALTWRPPPNSTRPRPSALSLEGVECWASDAEPTMRANTRRHR